MSDRGVFVSRIKHSARWAMVLVGTASGSSLTRAVADTPTLLPPSPRVVEMGASSKPLDAVLTTSVSEGWSVDSTLGRLKVSIPVGTMPGEISLPISINLDASPSTTTYLDGTETKTSSKKIASAWTLGFGPSTFGSSRYTLENGKVLNDKEFESTAATFTTYSANVNALFDAYGFTTQPLSDTCRVNASGDLLMATVPVSYGFGARYGSKLAGLAPNSAFFGAFSGYTLLMDKERVRVLAICGGMPYPIFIADRFGHYVTLEWSRNFGPSGDPIASITRVELRNQRQQGQQGMTLRMLDWALAAAPTTETVRDLGRLDYANFSAPSVLVAGYPSLPEGTGYGVAGRPTKVSLGRPEALAQPTWSGAYGAASDAPATVSSGAEGNTRTWNLAYNTNHEEITSLTDPTGLKSTFVLTSYATYNDQNSTAPFLSTYTVRGVSQVNQEDASGKSTTTRTLTWDRQTPALTTKINAVAVTHTDRWNQATNDRTMKFTFGDINTASGPLNAIDYQNSFMTSWTLFGQDGTTALATQSRTSRTLALGQGSGLNKSLSMVQSSTSTRQGEASTGTQSDYTDATCLRVSQVRSLVGGSQVASRSFQYDNRWAMLQPQQVKQVDDVRANTVLAPTKTTINVWDTATPPLLQLEKTYLENGTFQHGSQYTFDADGRLATKAGVHKESGAVVPSPSTLTMTYDADTGQPTTWVTSFLDGSSSSSVTKTQGDFDGAARPQLVVDEKGVSTRMTYDLFGRPLTIAKDGEAQITLSYPDEWTKITTQAGKTTKEYFDGFGRVIKQELLEGTTLVRTTVPTYDLHGRVTVTTERNKVNVPRTSTTTYDLLDRVTSQVSATGKRVDFTYTTDGVNNLVTQTVKNLTPELVTITKTDPFGQVISVKAPNLDTTTYTYDGWGNKTSVVITPAGGGASQTRSFTYDALGRLASKIEPETGTQTLSNFNALNQAQTLTEVGRVPAQGSRIRTMVYDGLGRLRSQVGGNVTESFTYLGAFLTSSSRTVGSDTVTQTFAYQAPGAKLSQETTTTSLQLQEVQ